MDARAFNEIVAKHYAALRRQAWTYGDGGFTAEEVVHASYLKVVPHVAKLETEQEALRYLSRTMHTVRVDLHRARIRAGRIGDIDDVAAGDEQGTVAPVTVEVAYRRSRLADACPPHDRDVLERVLDPDAARSARAAGFRTVIEHVAHSRGVTVQAIYAALDRINMRADDLLD